MVGSWRCQGFPHPCRPLLAAGDSRNSSVLCQADDTSCRSAHSHSSWLNRQFFICYLRQCSLPAASIRGASRFGMALRHGGAASTAGFPRHGALLGRPHRSRRRAVVEKLCKRLTGCRFLLNTSASHDSQKPPCITVSRNRVSLLFSCVGPFSCVGLISSEGACWTNERVGGVHQSLRRSIKPSRRGHGQDVMLQRLSTPVERA